MKKIAIEEHFWTEELRGYLRAGRSPLRGVANSDIDEKLLDVGEGRLRDMDESGIDMQVLCMASGLESFEAPEATAMSKRINNRIAEVVQGCPQRFAGFATVAPQDPEAAACEMERAVKDLGLKGVKINSHIRGEYLDNQKFWSILESAEKLDVPIYLHPRQPAPDKMIPYFDYSELAGSIWGYGAETGLHAMRLIVSGLFDKYPGLKIILGHLGEAIPHWLWRIDNRWSKEKAAVEASGRKLKKNPGQYFRENFYVSTSGMFWQPALLSTYMALGADKILFAVDYPYESNKDAVAVLDAAPICDSDKKKIYHLNAEKLLGIGEQKAKKT